MPFLLVLTQATIVLPEPTQLSSTVSPSFVYVRIRYSSSSTLFCVGCTVVLSCSFLMDIMERGNFLFSSAVLGTRLTPLFP